MYYRSRYHFDFGHVVIRGSKIASKIILIHKGLNYKQQLTLADSLNQA